jgi:hypothetical protein
LGLNMASKGLGKKGEGSKVGASSPWPPHS